MTTAQLRIDLLKITRAFGSVSTQEDKELGYETISKWTDASIKELKSWYNKDEIDNNFFYNIELAENSIKHLIR